MDIYNNNKKPSDETYKSFNDFIFSDDINALSKLLYRFKFYELTKDLPGDIVELGVFKGSGIATFSKFVRIFQPNSNKKIVGFDFFNVTDGKCAIKQYEEVDEKSMCEVYNRCHESELSLESVKNNLKHEPCILINGDVCKTIPEFLKKNPGFRISLLYMDLDLEIPTYESLKHLWDRILPGGIIIFDEYEHHIFSESNGVDKFIKEKGLEYKIKTTNVKGPTAYMIKV